MSLRLLLDEDSQAKYLLNLLQSVGHDVLRVNEANLMSRSDAVVLDYARQQERVVLTRNCADYQELHQANPEHPGILAVFQNPDRARNMNYQAIVRAIANIEAAEFNIKNQFVILNQWNY
ncbi:MAG: DUF5615 family PIN-like protein [Desertifilum sp.]|nr:DUF5615 family PIN-like protein [Desertifilum sp.]